jgi:hypothetical protein
VGVSLLNILTPDDGKIGFHFFDENFQHLLAHTFTNIALQLFQAEERCLHLLDPGQYGIEIFELIRHVPKRSTTVIKNSERLASKGAPSETM